MKRDIAIVGAGYVGVPLARTFADAGKSVLLVDVDASRVAQLNAGESYIEDVPTEALKPLVEAGLVAATTDYDELGEVDAILIALPTPISRQREPDLRILLSATELIAPRVRAGHLVVLESTTYPGTTREQVQPILERGSGLTAGKDFHLAFSPERVDPGREDWTTKSVTKVVGVSTRHRRPRRPISTRQRSTTSTAFRHLRPPSSRSSSRTSSARSTSPSSTSSRSCVTG